MRARVLLPLLALIAGCSQAPAPPATAPAAGGAMAARAATDAPIVVRTADGVTLTGLVTLPPGARGPVPVALFVIGAGAWDADYAATLPGGRRFQVLPLADLAAACAARGVAFVRWAKRGHADPAEWATTSLTNVEGDARAMLAAVRADRRFDPARLAIVGHSEGSALAQWIGRDVRALALLSVVRRNLRAIGRDMAVDGEVPRTMKLFDRDADGALDGAEIEAALAHKRGAGLAGWRDHDADRDGRLAPAEVAATYDARYAAFAGSLAALPATQLLTPTPWLGPAPAAWWREHFAHAPAGDGWKGRRTPVLVQHGEADPITPYVTEAAPLEAQLAAAGHPDHRLVAYPGLDHSFRDAAGASQAASVFGDLVPWLAARLVD